MVNIMTINKPKVIGVNIKNPTNGNLKWGVIRKKSIVFGGSAD